MPFTLLQVGNALKSMNSTGAISSALALPSGITLRTDRTPRFAKYNQYVVVVNTPTRPVIIDTSGVVYPLTPLPPSAAVALAGTGSGSLTGNYLGRQTYVIKDGSGNVITESDYSAVMASAASVTSQNIAWTLQASVDSGAGAAGIVSRLYRTSAGGAVYSFDQDTPTNATSLTDSVADAALSSVAAPDRGSAPDLTLIAEFAGRLWGVDRSDVDHLRYTEAGTAYGWSALNTLVIPHVGSDAAGITALIPRRDAIGVARLDVFQQVTGSTRNNFRPVVVNGGEKVGCVSQESVVVFNDVAYFLWRDGVYKWDWQGVSSITDGKVRAWFTTDGFFNRAMFWRAFALFDPFHLRYHLFLASVGSANIDRWVTYDLLTGSWWGPHKTDAFNPRSAVLVAGSNLQPWPMIGTAEGYLSQEQDAKNDWGGTAIALSAKTKALHSNAPDLEKYFGELTIFSKTQGSGKVSITPYTGSDPNSLTAGVPFSHDQTKPRERLGRIGFGEFMQLQFDHATVNEDVLLRGYVVDPVNPVGRR